MYKNFFKRVIDFSIALVALIVLALPLAVITIWLYFANKGAGAFFFQLRPGKNEKIFKLYKFKSMTDERDANGKLLPDAQRLTKVGKIVRGLSIDELPQLLNVLKGDMSLIGPRPLVPQYLPYYTDEEKHRHDVRPGITGWAQVNGRTSVDWGTKLALDVEYVKNLSFAMDVKILFLTVYKVIKKDDVGVGRALYDFNDYREEEWTKQGRQDLIDEARAKRNRK